MLVTLRMAFAVASSFALDLDLDVPVLAWGAASHFSAYCVSAGKFQLNCVAPPFAAIRHRKLGRVLAVCANGHFEIDSPGAFSDFRNCDRARTGQRDPCLTIESAKHTPQFTILSFLEFERKPERLVGFAIDDIPLALDSDSTLRVICPDCRRRRGHQTHQKHRDKRADGNSSAD